MRDASSHFDGPACWRRFRFPLTLGGCFLSSVAGTIFVGLEVQNNLIWVANGLLLSYLLLAPRWRWPAYLAAGFAAQCAGSMLINAGAWRMNLLLAMLNVAEVAVGAQLLRRRTNELPRFTESGYLVRFLGCAVLIAPAATGLVFAASSALWMHQAAWPAFRDWVSADAMGAAISTPACVAIFRTRLRMVDWKSNWTYPALLAVAAVAAFSQTRVPLLFLLYPLLILVLLRLGLGWAAAGIFFVAAVGSWYTTRGLGPFAMGPSPSTKPALLLQLHIAAGIFMLYAVSTVLESLRSTERRLQQIASLHQLVMQNSRDIIMLINPEGVPDYISPAVYTVTGWNPRETAERGFAEVIHPEDLGKMEALIRQLRTSTESGVIEYRVKRRRGGYVWVEGSLRAIRDPQRGGRTGILQIVRDISERKRAEEELRKAYRAVEELAVVDSLTGLANRRRFDDCLALEWRRALRDQKYLSMVLIDADLFKAYNDTYGHLRGDSCLKQIAESAMDVVTRPGDLVSRFGGEEFAVILPETNHDGALRIANEICDALRRRNLSHSASPHRIVTISAGCSTMIPRHGQQASDLIDVADQALYRAKRSGRNMVCDDLCNQD